MKEILPKAQMPVPDKTKEKEKEEALTELPEEIKLAETSVRLLPINLLDEPYFNYRKHPKEQLDNLTESLKRFGQRRTISVWKTPAGRYEVLAGNGIVQAAKRAKIKFMECSLAPSEWNEAQRKGFTIADNMRGSDDDLTLLSKLLDEQAELGYGLDSVGFDDEALSELLDNISIEASREVEPSERTPSYREVIGNSMINEEEDEGDEFEVDENGKAVLTPEDFNARGEKNKTPEARLMAQLTNPFSLISLHYMASDFSVIIAGLRQIISEQGLDTNSEAVKFLFDYYFAQKNQTIKEQS